MTVNVIEKCSKSRRPAATADDARPEVELAHLPYQRAADEAEIRVIDIVGA